MIHPRKEKRGSPAKGMAPGKWCNARGSCQFELLALEDQTRSGGAEFDCSHVPKAAVLENKGPVRAA